MIIKNELPILEYDDYSEEVIAPNHDSEDLVLPKKCLFTFVGNVVQKYAERETHNMVSSCLLQIHSPMYMIMTQEISEETLMKKRYY